MSKVTLDTNCLIDIEEKRPRSKYTNKIVSLWKSGEINLAVVAATASEKLIDGKEITDFSEFKNLLEMVGLADVEILKPPAYFGLSFWGWAVMGGGEVTELDHEIHDIICPDEPYVGSDVDDDEIQDWRNSKIDVLIAWAHIWNGRDFLVSSDHNDLLKNSDALESLGANYVIHPREFVSRKYA